MNKKKLLCVLLVMILTLSSASVFATRSQPMKIFDVGYWPGETEHLVGANDCISLNNANLLTDGVQIKAGGSATWGFYLPYSSRSVKIIYKGSGTLTLSTDENTYNPIVLSGNGEDIIEFGKNLGKDTDPQWRDFEFSDGYGFLREYVEHLGEKEITITCSEDVKIKELRFEKELTADPQKKILPNVSDMVMDTTTAVIMHENAAAIVVNGGRRYINNDNVYEKPKFYNGSLYLPINTLAKALGYYHEVMLDKNYILMRSDTHEIVSLNGKTTVARGMANPVEETKEVFVTDGGAVYAAVRYFAELTGETVGYKDGLIIIDDKYTVRDILADEEYFDFAYDQLKDFIQEKPKGKTYYVAQTNNANDENSGTLFAPFRTITKAASVAKAGDTVVVRGGTYRERLLPLNKGEAGAPITFKAAEGEEVILSANESLGTPVLFDEEKNEYVAPMPFDLGDGKNQIFINGEMQTWARYPDGPTVIADGRLSNAWPVWGDIYAAGYDTKTFISDSLLEQEDDYWVGATYVGNFGNNYEWYSAKITDSTQGKITVSDTLHTEWQWEREMMKGDGGNGYNWGSIVGHKNAMSVPGEWYVDDDKLLHIILPEDMDPNSITLEAKARQTVIDTYGNKFINIEGFKTIGGGVTMGKSEMCMLNGLDMKYISHYTLSADPMYGYIDFPWNWKQIGAPQRGEVGVYISGENGIIVNTHIDHSAGAGIYIEGSYGYVDNNIINDCGYMGSYTSGIAITTEPWGGFADKRGGHSIYNNTVYNVAANNINWMASEKSPEKWMAPFLPCEVAYNDFHDGVLGTNDMGMVYCNGLITAWDKKSTDVHHNYVYQTVGEEDACMFDAGIYWDGNCHGFDTFNNLIFSTNGGDGFRWIQQQVITPHESWERIWNNQIIGMIDLGLEVNIADSLKDEYFSENRPFYAGSTLNRETPYLKNYERFEKGEYATPNRAAYASSSEGVQISADDGYATFTGDGQYIEFKNVDFGEKSNFMVLDYYCDSNWTYDELEVIVDPNSPSGGSKYKVTLQAQDAPSDDLVCTRRFAVDDFGGLHDVRVKVNKYYSVRLGGISVYDHTAPEREDYALYTYASDVSEYQKTDNRAWRFPTDFAGVVQHDPNARSISAAYSGITAKYSNQKVKENASHFIMSAGGLNDWSGQKINVYLTTPSDEFVKSSGEPHATFTILNSGDWDDMEPMIVPVNKEVKAGTYDIYVELEYGSAEKCSRIEFFGFLKESADKSNYTELIDQITGGLFNESLSSEDAEYPFFKHKISRKYEKRKAIHNTLPGTTAGFSGIQILKDSSRISVYYLAPNMEKANQPVNVRVTTLNNETVATASFVTEYTEGPDFHMHTYDLSNSVPAGEYLVYFDFGGAKGSSKTFRLGWFQFDE